MSGKGGYFQKLSLGSETSDKTSQGLGEMFEGDSADTCTGNSAHVDGGPGIGLACADPGARTPIGVKGIVKLFTSSFVKMKKIRSSWAVTLQR